jgi:hypothetical protein
MAVEKPRILNYSASAPAQDWLMPVAIGAALVVLTTFGLLIWASYQAGC